MSSELIVIPRLLGKGAAKQLLFDETGITITHETHHIDYISWHNFAAIRVKAVALHGLYFNIGRCYVIDMQTDEGNVHTLNLKSIYGIKNKQYAQLWMHIYNLIYHYHFNLLLGYYTELKAAGQVFIMSDISVYADGISWDNHPKLKWSEIEISPYIRYFVIRKKGDSSRRKFLYFGDDWNACLLLDLLKQFLNAPNGNISKRKTPE